MNEWRCARVHRSNFLHLARCAWIIGDDYKLKQFTKADQDKMITNLIEPMANDALRTICIAYKDYLSSKYCVCCLLLYRFIDRFGLCYKCVLTYFFT